MAFSADHAYPSRCPGVFRALVVALIAIVLQGCASAPPAEDALAPVALPEQFSATGSELLPEHWWRSFNDPTLNQLQRQALAGNFTLAAARARLRQARALSVQAGAAQSPQVDGSGQARQDRSGENITTERYGLGLAAAYEVDLWGRIDAATRAAEAEELAVAADLQTAAVSLTAELASTYFQLVQQRGIVELLLEQEETNAQIAGLIRLRVLNGRSSLDELLRQQQLLSQSRGQLLQAQSQAELLSQQLSVLAGRTPNALAALEVDGDPFLPPLPATGIPAEWLRKRPDLIAAFARLEAADADVARAVSAQYPRLNLTASLETTASRPSALFEGWLATLAGGLSAPLIDGGNLRARVDQALASRDQALANYRQTLLDSLAEVEGALLAERRDQSLLASADQQLQLAQAALEQLTYRYRNGATDYLNVLSTLTSVQSLQRERVALLYQRLQNRIALNRSLAGAWYDEPLTEPDPDPEPTRD